MTSYPSGEVAERFKAPVLKTGEGIPFRGFESHPHRHFFLYPFHISYNIGFE